MGCNQWGHKESDACKVSDPRIASESELKRSIWIRFWGWHHIRLSRKDVSELNLDHPKGWEFKGGSNLLSTVLASGASRERIWKDTEPLPFYGQCSFGWVVQRCRGNWGCLRVWWANWISGLLLHSDPMTSLPLSHGHRPACLLSHSFQFADLTSALSFKPAPATISHSLGVTARPIVEMGFRPYPVGLSGSGTLVHTPNGQHVKVSEAQNPRCWLSSPERQLRLTDGLSLNSSLSDSCTDSQGCELRWGAFWTSVLVCLPQGGYKNLM